MKNFRKVPTYLHFIYNILLYIMLYYVGCLHIINHTYIKQTNYAVNQHLLHAILMKHNQNRLMFPMRNKKLRIGNKLFHEGNKA